MLGVWHVESSSMLGHPEISKPQYSVGISTTNSGAFQQPLCIRERSNHGEREALMGALMY